MADAFPDEGWTGLTSGDWRELQAKRYLNIEEGLFMVTGANIENAVSRFRFREEVFFNMRPDFAFRSLASDLVEQPINAVELAMWNRLLEDYGLETGAIKRAIDSKELLPTNVYPLEWWREFWFVRGFGEVLTAVDQLPAEGPARDLLDKRAETTYLTIIGALLELVRTPRAGRDSDAAVIRELIDNYSDKPGISKTTLEAKFADARRRLRST